MMLRRWLNRWRRPAAAPDVPAAPGLDLVALRSLDSAEIELRHPVDGTPLGAFVTLASPESPAFRQARLDIVRAQRDADAPDYDASIELLDEASGELLARVVLGWRGIRDNGEDLPWSPAAVRQLLSRAELRWLVNQLLAELRRAENFIEASATS